MSVPIYTVQGWVDDDGSGTVGTPYTAARMTHIEEGVRDATILPAYDGTSPPSPIPDSDRVVWKRTSDGAVVAYIQAADAAVVEVGAQPAATGGSATSQLAAHAYPTDGANDVAVRATSTPGSTTHAAVVATVKDQAGAGSFDRTIIDSKKQSDLASSMGAFKVGLSTATTIGTTSTLVPYTDKTSFGGFDRDGWWDATNFRYNPKRAGYYTFSGGWRFAGTPASGNGLWVSIFKNGTQLVSVPANLSLAATANPGGPIVSPPVFFNGSTDYIDIRPNLASGSLGLSVDASTNWISGYFIGA